MTTLEHERLVEGCKVVKVKFKKGGLRNLTNLTTGSRLRFNQASRLMNRDREGICKKSVQIFGRGAPRGVVLSCYHNRELLFATFPFLKRQLLHFTES